MNSNVRRHEKMEPNWEAIGAIGEVSGTLVIVFTLGYLAVQIRIAKSAAADTNRLTRASGVREAHLAMVNNDQLLESAITAYGAESYYHQFGDQFSLSLKEAARLDFMHQYWFWLHWGQFSSVNDPGDLQELSHVIEKFYVIPAVRYSWENSPYSRPMMDPSFVQFVDEAIARNG